MSFTVGSLFDGSGGFPLAAFMSGGVPLWASEIEPYPIAVTKSRFPYMKHLGDVAKVKGDEIEPVDVITFGSPCQDLSVAGKRAGLKHEDNGDDETTRSGLFMEAIRIIKEMREKTNGEYPRFAVWENVPGAFSSNKGEDLRIVLEELIKIVEPTAVMPSVPKNGWAYADCYSGDGWSLAYRTFDAQYIRTAQRRKRIYLVLCLTDEWGARKVLFEREGLRGNYPSCGTPWEGTPADDGRSATADDSARDSVTYGFPLGFRPENVRCYEETATTLCNGTRAGFCNGVIVPVDALPFVTTQVTSPYNYSNPQWGDACHPLAAGAHPPSVVCKCYDARGNGDGETVNTLIGDHENRVTDYTSLVVLDETVAIEGNGQRPSHHGDGYCVADKSYTLNSTEVHGVAYGVESPIVLDRAFYNQGQNALYEPQFYENGIVPPIVAKGPSAVCYKYIVRRLTPTECSRLQGFPDFWGHPDKKTEFTDEEYEFWLDTRNTHAKINGKAVKDYNRKQMLTWYNKLHVDTSEYRMWGNGIALPCAVYVMEGIAEILN